MTRSSIILATAAFFQSCAFVGGEAALSGCGGSQKAPTQAQVTATTRGTVETVDAALSLAATTCADAAEFAPDAGMKPRCLAILTPAAAFVTAAAQAVDRLQAGTDSNAANEVACDLQAAAAAINAVALLGVGMPDSVVVAESMVGGLKCEAAIVDAGGGQ